MNSKKSATGLETTKDKMQAKLKISNWKVLNEVQKIDQFSGIQICRKNVNYNSDGVKIKKRLDKKGNIKHYYSGLMQCGHTWTCPFCAETAAREKETTINLVVDKVIDEGLNLSHVVFTLYHDHKMSLESLFAQFKKVIRTMKNRKPFKTWKKQNGIIGDIKAYEVRLGENGWHLHSHYCFISDKFITEKTLSELFPMFQEASIGITTRKPSEKAFFCREAFFDDTARYLTKWSPGKELAIEESKTGTWSESFWKLVENSTNNCLYSRAKVYEYCQATKKQRRIVFSKGLKKWAGIEEQLTEIEKTEDEIGEIVYNLEESTWWTIVQSDLREEILLIFDNNDIITAILLLKKLTPLVYRPPGPTKKEQKQ